MIYGVGVDITVVRRFEKWIDSPEKISRFFNPKEIKNYSSVQKACEHYAARFAAKEAFSKALGTGLTCFPLQDVYIQNDENGKPELIVENKALTELKNRCGNCKVHVSLSHEKDSAVAFVVIEN